MPSRIQPTRRSARRRIRTVPTTSPYLNNLTINNVTINNVNNSPSGPEPPNRRNKLITVILDVIKWAGILLLWRADGG